MKPHPDTTESVRTWIESHGVDITSVTTNSARDWLTLRLPLSKVESMLDAKYYLFKHKRSDEQIVRTLSYSLPLELHEHIDLIQPTTMFDNMRKMHATSHVNKVDPSSKLSAAELAALPDVTGPNGQQIAASCNTTITPTCLMQLYRTEGYVPKAANKGNRIGITGFLEQVLKPANNTYRC